MTSHIDIDDVAIVFVLWAFMLLSRFASIAFFMQPLQQYGYSINKLEAFAMSWMGLKGAIGLTFAMAAAKDTKLSPEF